MQSLAEVPLAATLDGATMPRFQDGTTDMQGGLLRQLTESIVNEIVDAEADQVCARATAGTATGSTGS